MYKVFYKELHYGDATLDIPEGYTIDMVLSSSNTHVHLLLRKIELAKVSYAITT